MNWLNDFVRPRIKKLVKRDVPENLWTKCQGCDEMIFAQDLKANLFICKNCGHHCAISPEDRLKALFDEGHYKTLRSRIPPIDPLGFRDAKRYKDRLKEAQKKHNDSVLLAEGTVHAHPLVVAVFDFQFIGGSLGTAAGEAVLEGALHSLHKKKPYMIIAASGGARMQEGILSLMQMPRTLVGIQRLREEGLPFISLLTHPTTGGVSASFASLGDINLAEPGALIGFTGARVIQQILRTPLPEGFQKAEFQFIHGAIDKIVPRHEIRETLSNILSVLKPEAA